MVSGQDMDTKKMKRLMKKSEGKERLSQRGTVDAVMKNLGVGRFLFTLEGRTRLDDDCPREPSDSPSIGNPSWYLFL